MRGTENGFSLALNTSALGGGEQDLPPRWGESDVLAARVCARLRDELQSPDQRDQLAGEAVGTGRQAEAELAPLLRPGAVEGESLDHADVLASLALGPPEEAQLDFRGRRVERPGRGSSELLARLESETSPLRGDLEPAHDELPG